MRYRKGGFRAEQLPLFSQEETMAGVLEKKVPPTTCISRGCEQPVTWYMVGTNGGIRWGMCDSHWVATGQHSQTAQLMGIAKEDYEPETVVTESVARSSPAERGTSGNVPATGSRTPTLSAERRPAPSRPHGQYTDSEEGERQLIERPRTPQTVSTERDGGGETERQVAPISWEGFATVRFTKEQEAILRQPVNPELVEIRYDGAVYMPGAWYRKILNDAFGPGGWGIVQEGEPQESNGEYYMRALLIAEGRVVARTVAEFIPQQKKVKPGLGTVWESLTTDAITKCCKTLGVAEELWWPAFTRQWQQTYATKKVSSSGYISWTRNDPNMGAGSFKPGYDPESEYSKPPRLKDEIDAHMEALAYEADLGDSTDD